MTDPRHTYIDVLTGYLAPGTVLDGTGDTRPLRALGLNSLRAVDLAIDLETHFDFTFPDALFSDETFATAESLWTAVGALVEDVKTR